MFSGPTARYLKHRQVPRRRHSVRKQRGKKSCDD